MVLISPDSPGQLEATFRSSDIFEAKATESDDGSGSASVRSTTPLPGTRSKPSLSAYARHGESINSSDTLRQIPSPVDSSTLSSSGNSGNYWTFEGTSEETICQETQVEQLLDVKLKDGVALRAAKGSEETINAKRAMVASLHSQQTSWDILQGKRDEQVEEQVNILGLDIRISQDSGIAASDISRTPSRSTTGTEKSASGSFGTAASSLQSTPSSDSNLHDKDATQSIAAPLPLDSSQNHSPKLYITACFSADDLLQQKRSDNDTLRRYHALLELIETEKGYVEDLSTLANVFFQNLSTQAFFDESEARLKAVRRNVGDLLDIHITLGRQLSKIVEDYQISHESEGSDMEKALKCEEAIVQVARQLSLSAPSFEPYQVFCSRHAEALVLIREAEKRHNGDDFVAFERMCGNQIRGNSKAPRRNNTPSRRSSAGSSTPLAANNTLHLEETSTTPTSGSNTPSGSFASISRQASGRLLFADYLIKPIQRLCLYPLVLNSLLKFTPVEETIVRQALEEAMSGMRKIADDVDMASKQREKDLMTEVLLNKIEVQPGLTSTFLKSLGNPLLSGTLDTLYHHDVLFPLTAPLRFQRLGLILWHGFLLFVRVRKNQQLDCKYWIPLGSAQLTRQEETISPSVEITSWDSSSQTSKQLVPFAMRISYFGHNFELSALNDKERSIWHQHLSSAIDKAPISTLEAFPSNLSTDIRSLNHSASASILNYFVSNSKNMSNAAETLVRLPSPSARVAVDRNMIFSEKLLSQGGFNAATSNSGGGYGPVQFTQKDFTEALITQQLRQNSTPSIGSAVGAAMGLARLAATQVPTAVKRSRRQSMLNLTEITPTCDSLLSESPSELSPGSNTSFPQPLMKRSSIASFRFKSDSAIDANDLSPGASNNSSNSNNNGTGNIKWRNSLLRRNSRILGSKTPTNSVPPSPMTSVTDLSQSLKVDVSLTPAAIEDAITTKPKHLRSKFLRDVWQNSIGRRNRSQSNNSSNSSNSSEIVAFPSNNLLASLSGTSSLTSSPMLENTEMEFGSLRRADYSAKTTPDLEMNTANRNRFSSFDSAGSSSIAHLKRILNSTSNQGSLTLSRARASGSGSRFIASNKVNESSPSPSPNVTSKSRARVERSKTELVFSVLSSPEVHNSDRRYSEPDALHLERRKSIIGLSAQHPLRRLGRKKSYNGPSSPASSVLSLANLTLSPSWADHSQLNSVEEHTSEVNEGAVQSSAIDASKTKPTRPTLFRRPSTAEM